MRQIEQIHSTVPYSGDTCRTAAVYDVLKEHAGAWMTASAIASAAGICHADTEPAVRRAVAILLEHNGVPVISSTRGFKFTADDAELDECIKQLAGRIRGIQARIAGLQRIKTAHAQGRPVAGAFPLPQLEQYVRSIAPAANGTYSAQQVVEAAVHFGVTCATVFAALDRKHSAPQTDTPTAAPANGGVKPNEDDILF